MDPKTCWECICAAFAEGRVDDALWQMDDLQKWLRNGGFRPDFVPLLQHLIAARPFLEGVLAQQRR